MSSATPLAPAHEIPRRDLRFTLDGVDLRHWHPAGIHVAHFFNLLSTTFPEGETFFIDSVREVADRVRSPELAVAVEGFLGQEAMHSREHRRYNRALKASGVPADELERAVVRILDWVRATLGPAEQLAATIALEHFTAILADVVLQQASAFDGADPRLAALWRWHAVEETEHKAVAFDVYREVFGDDLGAYARRSIFMVLAAIIFWTVVIAFQLRLAAADRALLDWRSWWSYGRFMLLSPGMLSRTALPWLGYFRFDFHPWQHDNLALVRAWKAMIGAEEALPT